MSGGHNLSRSQKQNGGTNTNTDIYTRFENYVGAVMRSYRCIQKLKSAQSKELGLKANHVMCLYFLGKHADGLTAAELCKLCHEDKAAISRTVFDLTQKELVLPTEPSAKKKYRTVIKLTERGAELSNRLQSAIERMVKAVSDDFSEAERDTFYRMLFSITDGLEGCCADGGETE